MISIIIETINKILEENNAGFKIYQITSQENKEFPIAVLSNWTRAVSNFTPVGSESKPILKLMLEIEIINNSRDLETIETWVESLENAVNQQVSNFQGKIGEEYSIMSVDGQETQGMLESSPPDSRVVYKHILGITLQKK